MTKQMYLLAISARQLVLSLALLSAAYATDASVSCSCDAVEHLEQQLASVRDLLEEQKQLTALAEKKLRARDVQWPYGDLEDCLAALKSTQLLLDVYVIYIYTFTHSQSFISLPETCFNWSKRTKLSKIIRYDQKKFAFFTHCYTNTLCSYTVNTFGPNNTLLSTVSGLLFRSHVIAKKRIASVNETIAKLPQPCL
jgi:hypothetical protein